MFQPDIVRTGAVKAPFKFRDRLKEISLFFQGRDEVHKTMRRLCRRLERAGIPYAIVGGMALNAHHHRRTTNDVDVLLTPEGFEEFRQRFVSKKYRPVAGRRRRFIDRVNQVTVDILLTGLRPGFGKSAPIRFPDPASVSEEIDTIQVVDLATLIELKLAARRVQDFADVVALIRTRSLDESFAARLHRALRRSYLEGVDEAREEQRREEEYEAQE